MKTTKNISESQLMRKLAMIVEGDDMPAGEKDSSAADSGPGPVMNLFDVLDEHDLMALETRGFDYSNPDLNFLNKYLAHGERKGAWWGDLRAVSVAPDEGKDEVMITWNKRPPLTR